MNSYNFKIVEIRDRATFIPALAINMIPENSKERFLFYEIGYKSQNIILMSLQNPRYSARYSEEWDNVSPRTMKIAHEYIEKNFDNIKNLGVIDVEYILGEEEKPSLSVRLERINEKINLMEDERSKIDLIKFYHAVEMINDTERLFDYATWKCEICKKERLDKFISVHKLKPKENIEYNIKYCNDNKDCIDKVMKKESL